MADKKYNEVKLGLTVAKSGLTKAIRKLEECGKEMSKLEADLATASKVRLAASLLEALETVSKKNKEVRHNRDKWLDEVVAFDPVEFEKNSKKSKEMLIEDSEKDVENYEEKAEQLIRLLDKEIKEAEKLLAKSVEPKLETEMKNSSETSEIWLQFKPQQNLEPLHLEQGVSHLEVTKFVEAMRTYIRVGFRGAVPEKGVWVYIVPFLAASWWASLKAKGAQDMSLDDILKELLEESSLLCPVHQRRIEFLKEKRNNCSHSDFLRRIEERVELIEFQTLTKESLVCHIFLEEADFEMQKIATQLLAKNPKGDLDELRTQVKTTESSNWYKPGARARASKAGQDGGTGRWCTNCESGTHNTAFCFRKCFICKGFGHKAAQCRNRNDTGPPNVGGGKKAGADAGAGAEPGAGAEKLSKGARRRQNQAKRKEE